MIESLRLAGLIAVVCAIASPVARAQVAVLQTHCAKCHGGEMPKGGFRIADLGRHPDEQTIDLWVTALDFVEAGEMPPAEAARLTDGQKSAIADFLRREIRSFESAKRRIERAPARRLNNRELARAVADVLMIEDVGTHQPLGNLISDTLYQGFDTNGEALGMSEFHLEQYLEAFRKVIDATILAGPRPPSAVYRVPPGELRMTSLSQNSKRRPRGIHEDFVDFHDPRLRIYFHNFDRAPHTGWYRIKIRATGVDRGVYDQEQTGIYGGDPIRLSVHMGDRVRTFDLPDGEVREIVLTEWLAAGTRIELSYPTDGLRLRGNGNFKFQYSIAHDYLREHDPQLYRQVVRRIAERAPERTRRNVAHWSHWVDYWQGPRPRVFGAEVEGPFYKSWPPERQRALLGPNPDPQRAAEILQPLAERAWRRAVSIDELQPIARLVQAKAAEVPAIEAFKEGVIAILMSPSFLMVYTDEGTAADRSATKLSLVLRGTIPDRRLRQLAAGGRLDSYDQVLAELRRMLVRGEADEFLRTFPYQWLQLDRINFMAPDPDRYRHFDRKRVSDDMVEEVRQFFRYAVKNNVPVPELLTADYSLINADLAKVYGVTDVPPDSRFRKYTFTDGRRGGFLGMGAFLTLTADTMSTSPIHRAVYVMENFMGIHPAPPPGDVNIREPDIRQARTIREIQAAHRKDTVCASCHETIDPWGFAFENFDPAGAWRDFYTEHIPPRPPRAELAKLAEEDRRRAAQGLPPLPKPWEMKPLPIDASARFRNGLAYRDITEFRRLMKLPVNRDRFVRCFIVKLLTFANGVEPRDYSRVQDIVAQSAQHDYRIVETIAAVLDSPLFREERIGTGVSPGAESRR
ncbi:MAG: DUF1592 domain-containing protein [Planctomycetota bacterium]|nr:MAG: DUF1592 domain-containing protein [Planctomycetota bacterium]